MASPTDWSRVIGTTIVNHLREEELTTFRKFKIFAMLESSGNVIMNQSGRGFDWNVRYRNAPVSGNTGDTPRTFSRVNMWKKAELPWRGFTTTDAIGFSYGVTWNTVRRNIFNWKDKEIGNLENKIKSFCAIPQLLKFIIKNRENLKTTLSFKFQKKK